MADRDPPARSAFDATERALVRRLTTPARVQRFLRALPYNPEDTWRSFRETMRAGRADCFEGALAAAAILEAAGHPPLLLDLESQDDLDHVLFLYRVGGRFGTVGASRYPGLLGRKPVYPTIRQLALSYYDPYVDERGRVTGYGVLDLRDLPEDVDWRFSAKPLRAVYDALCALPHRALRTSDARYERLRARYRRFKERHPDREPTYYATVANWLE